MAHAEDRAEQRRLDEEGHYERTGQDLRNALAVAYAPLGVHDPEMYRLAKRLSDPTVQHRDLGLTAVPIDIVYRAMLEFAKG